MPATRAWERSLRYVFTSTVDVLRRQSQPLDEYGEPTAVAWVEVETNTPALVTLVSADETGERREALQTVRQLVVPPGSTLDHGDRVRWNGVEHEVLSLEKVYNPLTGQLFHVKARIQEAR